MNEMELPTGNDLTIATLEKKHIARVLAEHRWQIHLCSKLLGISKPTLYRKIKLYELVK